MSDIFWRNVAVGENDSGWEWTLFRNPQGYGRGGGSGNGHFYAHRRAWELTNGPIPDGNVVCHRCDNPACCNPAHLFVGPQSANMVDAKTKDRFAIGGRHGMARLTDADVKCIKRKMASGVLQRIIAEEYGIGRTTVSSIARGQTWTHVSA